MGFVSSKEFITALPLQGRLLGVDWGDKRIGLALSDIGRMIASPYQQIERQKLSLMVTVLKHHIMEQGVVGVVMGLPLLLSGGMSNQTRSIQDTASALGPLLPIPLTIWDERFSSSMADKAMLEGDLSRVRRQEKRDKLAAAYMLQGILDWAKNHR
jgi:putative holliday junction resolvase